MAQSYSLSTKSSHGFWQGSLAYPQSFATVIAAMSLGLAMHLWVGYRALTSFSPIAVLTVVLAPLVALGVSARQWPGARVVRWVTGIPFAVVSATAFGLLAIFGGTVPQRVFAERFGVDSIWSSWPFILVGYLVLANLIGSCCRRLLPLSYTNAVYQLTHLGLAIAILGGMASGLMLERRTMVLFHGVPTSTCGDRFGNEYQAPFTAELKAFRMETFAPTVTLASVDEREPNGMRQVPGSALLNAGATETIGSFRLWVLEYLDRAAFTGRAWKPVAWKSGVPAARLLVVASDGKRYDGWVSCGGLESSPSYLMVAEDQAILMNQPRPKKFESDIVVDGKTHRVGVNEPAHLGGVTVYQFGYDETLGRASNYSVLELVRDPALPIVYGGIFGLLAGTLLHLWNGVGGRK